MTTNGFGSHIAYAAAFGAKVSIFGPVAEFSINDYRRVPFYQDYPGLAERIVPLYGEKVLRKNYSEFFTLPIDAEERRSWGRKQIGLDCILAPDKLEHAFRWDSASLKRTKGKQQVKAALRKTVPKAFRVWFHESRQAKGPNETKWASLEANPELGEMEVEGRRFHFTDSETFRGTYKSIFERHFYRIPVVIEKPLILDCGANIGLATRYWLSKYPKAEIVAFEPDPKLFETLKRNCAEVPDANVQLHCAAVWNKKTELVFQSTGVETGAVQGAGTVESGDSIKVQAIDLAEFLDRRVDFLKLDIEGAECDVIPSLDGKLEHVMAMYIEYHSYYGQPQRLAAIIETLESNGFRHAINTNFASQQPMRKIESSYGMDMRLDVWAWK